MASLGKSNKNADDPLGKSELLFRKAISSEGEIESLLENKMLIESCDTSQETADSRLPMPSHSSEIDTDSFQSFPPMFSTNKNIEYSQVLITKKFRNNSTIVSGPAVSNVSLFKSDYVCDNKDDMNGDMHSNIPDSMELKNVVVLGLNAEDAADSNIELKHSEKDGIERLHKSRVESANSITEDATLDKEASATTSEEKKVNSDMQENDVPTNISTEECNTKIKIGIPANVCVPVSFINL